MEYSTFQPLNNGFGFHKVGVLLCGAVQARAEVEARGVTVWHSPVGIWADDVPSALLKGTEHVLQSLDEAIAELQSHRDRMAKELESLRADRIAA